MSDENNTNEMLDRIKAMLENGRQMKDTIILNSAWRDVIEGNTSKLPYERTDQLMGSKIVYSSFVETGKVYMMDTPKFEPPRFSTEMRRFEEEIIPRIFQSFGIPPRYFEQPERPYKWQKQSFENLLQWGERLASRGLLDNPDIRWVYQWAILCFIVGYPLGKLKLLKLNSR
jgi:hypothetical protein